MENDNKFLSVKETAQFLGVTEIHLRKMLNEGKIPYINVATGKLRKSIRIEKKAVEEFAAGGGVK